MRFRRGRWREIQIVGISMKQRQNTMSLLLSSDALAAFLPYGRQRIEEDDIEAVVAALRSDWLTTGPKVGEFEAAVCAFTGAQYGVAVSSGTAALHAAMYALGIGSGDEVIVPAMTFAATANGVVYQGGTPVFADVDPETLLIDPMDVARKITAKTKAIIAVDYAGQPCDYEALRGIADQHGLALVADACHALGGTYTGRKVGTLADLTVFSFHPVKHITTGEGGMVVTDNPELAARMRRFRNHGIDTDYRQREAEGTWYYEMTDIGFNYRISDIQCALGINQLRKLPTWLMRRRKIAGCYNDAFRDLSMASPLVLMANREHAYHLYVMRHASGVIRDKVFRKMREMGIGVNVHYIPVYLHPYYRRVYGYAPGLCPEAERAFSAIFTLPIGPGVSDADVERVVASYRRALAEVESHE